MKNVYSRSFESAPPRNITIASVSNKELYFYNKNCYTSDIKHHKNKKAFTLAEVLITLGIIGVVAAMTMPNLIANYKNKVLINQAKNSFSTLSNELIMTKVNNGLDSYEDLFQKDRTSDEILDIISKELKVIKTCKSGKGGCISWKTKYQKKQFQNGKTVYSDMRTASSAILSDGSVIIIQNFTNQRQSGCNWVNSHPKRDEAGNIVKDENGNDIIINTQDNRCGAIKVDVNGGKGPNQFGADTFDLGVYPNKLHGNYSFLYNDKLDYENYAEGEDY